MSLEYSLKTTKGQRFAIVRLEDGHKIDSFGCGKSKLNGFIKNDACPHQWKGYSVTFVALLKGEKDIAGYITLSASCVGVKDIGEDLIEQLGIPTGFAMPTLHVGRFAVRSNHRGEGIGRALMLHAFDIAIEASERMGIFAVDLFIEDPDLLPKVYGPFGFTVMDEEGSHLYVQTASIRQAYKPPSAIEDSSSSESQLPS